MDDNFKSNMLTPFSIFLGITLGAISSCFFNILTWQWWTIVVVGSIVGSLMCIIIEYIFNKNKN